MRTLSSSVTLIELLQERAYTNAQLKAHPLTADLSDQFESGRKLEEQIRSNFADLQIGKGN